MFQNRIKELAKNLKLDTVRLTVLALTYRALVENKWCRVYAAEKLGVSVKTVRANVKVLKKYGFEIEDFRRDLYGVRYTKRKGRPKKHNYPERRKGSPDTGKGFERSWVSYEEN